MKVTHFDLFAGIGGFSLALDNIIKKENVKHIFVERDKFCQLVLKKHWPEAEYHFCINEFVANVQQSSTRLEKSYSSGQNGREANASRSKMVRQGDWKIDAERARAGITILTGGFPCQPFSQAGRRQGTADDRYLWPAMFESIKLIQPDWIVAENVAGLVTWNEGLVLEQVCVDLESEGYEVQPFVIPACAVNAPHRRDRVWIVANRNSERQSGDWKGRPQIKGQLGLQNRERNEERRNSWQKNWLEVATSLCRVDDGLPRRLDRNPRLKALGNAIVPAVAEEIFRKIGITERLV